MFSIIRKLSKNILTKGITHIFINNLKKIKEQVQINGFRIIRIFIFYSLKNIVIKSHWFKKKNLKTLFELLVIANKKGNPDAFIDCGPGLLYTEAWWIKKNWKNCMIIGLEPSPSRYKNLKAKYPGILLNKAIGEKVGILKGMINSAKRQFISDLNTNLPQIKYLEISIEMLTIDSLNEKYGPFNNIFIWADIEGDELKLLKGAINSLTSGIILGFNFELWPRNTNNKSKTIINSRNSADQVLNFLKKYKFKIYGKEAEELMSRDPNFESSKWSSDYIFLKN